MKVFITGATGFVGSHLAEKLFREGHDVYILVRSLKKQQEFNVPGTIIQGSLSFKSPNSWINQLPEELDAVIHTAGLIYTHNSQDFYDINTTATEVLIKDLIPKYKELKFMITSSLAAAGPTTPEKVIDETRQPMPVSDYGKSKHEAEKIVEKLCPQQWQQIIIRPPIVIGPRDPAILDVFKMVKQGIVVMPGSDGLTKEFSFVSVFDLINVMAAAIQNDRSENPQIYFTSSPEKLTFGKLVDMAKEDLNKSNVLTLHLPYTLISIAANLIHQFAKVIPTNIRLTKDKVHEITAEAWLCSGEKSQKDFKLEYQGSLESIVKETIKDYRSRGWL